MKIFVKAKPGARRALIKEIGGLFNEGGERQLIVAVKERAVDGKANRAIEQAIADYLGVPSVRVRIISGHTSREKTVEVLGL